MKSSLNLLPYTLRRRQIVRLRFRQWCFIWAAAAAIASGIVYWTQYASCQSCLADLQMLERKYAPLKKMETELNSMRAQMDDLQKRETLALSLADDVPDLTLLGTISRAAYQSNGSVYVKQWILDRKTTPQRHDKNSVVEAPKRSGMLTLQGAGIDNLSVARFVAALRDSGVFDVVELKSTGMQATRNTEARGYLVECMF